MRWASPSLASIPNATRASPFKLQSIMRVLIVEDTPAVARLLRQSVSEAGYAPEVETDGIAALARAKNDQFDLVLLDWMLPGMSGLEVCRSLRKEGQNTPILMLTARDTTEDKVAGLDAGADDYIVKPFAVVELLARMRALLRRGAATPTAFQVADLTLDPTTRRASRAGKTIYLSATEYALLEYLMRHAGKTLTRTQLLDHVWQYDFGGNDNVSRLLHLVSAPENRQRRRPPALSTPCAVWAFDLGE